MHTAFSQRVRDLSGMTVGRLTVLRYVGSFPRGKGSRAAKWLCRCDCGQERIIFASSLVKTNPTSSCGCLQAERSAACDAGESRESAFKKLLVSYEYGSRHRGHIWELSEPEARELFSGPCHYCGSEPAREISCRRTKWRSPDSSFFCNGIDRIDNAMGYIAGNCVPCCGVCNYAKRNMSQSEFIAWILRAASHIQEAKLCKKT